jgi:NTP pyrophosphatase (non-canonical NTP hydrolase)
MNNRDREILLIAQEECAEVIQAISKIFRFGFDAQHPNEDRNNLQRLEEELGDLVCMIGLLMNKKIVSESNVESAAELKLKKLRTWSTIFVGEPNPPR